MKTVFKPLGIAAAVAAVTAGYAGVANAQAVANNGLGDLALVPYYTTAGDFVTGVHIINTSDRTQVVKLRLRRATDSMDAMDFNLIMSPRDEWTGFITGEADGAITFNTSDTTCTAPIINGSVTMSSVYRRGADSGYIEVIGMGSPESESYTIARDAEHVNGVPRDCTAVATNFFANGGSSSPYGNVDSWETIQQNIVGGASVLSTNYFDDTDNVLKVSYFIRNEVAGLEFGNDAVHIQDFHDEAMMTNQEFGTFSGDMRGFDFPDLNGGSPVDDIPRDSFDLLRQTDVLGVLTVLNDWSKNPANGVNTDWVVTLPGQYTMLNLPNYLLTGADIPAANSSCDNNATVINGVSYAIPCDLRDIPVTAEFSTWDREEGSPVAGSGSLVVSPSIPGAPDVTRFQREVNVVQWGDESVLDADSVTSVDPGVDQPYGWAQVSVTSKIGTQAVCNWPDASFNPNAPGFNPLTVMSCDGSATGAVPMIGFVAWERNFPSNPAANYGRIVEHSYTTTSMIP